MHIGVVISSVHIRMRGIDYDTSDHCCETGIFSTNAHAFTSINVWGVVAQCVDVPCGVWGRVLCAVM